jgi:hypothetical protein
VFLREEGQNNQKEGRNSCTRAPPTHGHTTHTDIHGHTHTDIHGYTHTDIHGYTNTNGYTYTNGRAQNRFCVHRWRLSPRLPPMKRMACSVHYFPPPTRWSRFRCLRMRTPRRSARPTRHRIQVRTSCDLSCSCCMQHTHTLSLSLAARVAISQGICLSLSLPPPPDLAVALKRNVPAAVQRAEPLTGKDSGEVRLSPALRAQCTLQLWASGAATTDFDETGSIFWPACRPLCQFLALNPELFRGRAVLEVGVMFVFSE